ncbi:MAG: asparagine synthase-related protein [Gemmatimonadota bacterium]
MDALVAVLGSSDHATGDLGSMLDAHWPESERHDARYEAAGIALAATRTAAGGAVVGLPRVHQIGSVRAVQRFDWPSLAGPAPVPWFEDGASPSPATPTTIAWDEATRTLIVARDPMGESPLWYAAQPGRLAVATYPGALRALPWVSDAPDPLGWPAFEARIPLLAGETRWRDLRRLPPGHLLVARDGRIEIHAWWALEPTRLEALPNDAGWFERIRLALERSVARRIPAAGAVGTQLSGGLDSSAVALLAARALAPPGRALHTFSHVPAVRWNPPQPGDETPYVEAVLGCMPNAIPHFATGESGPPGPAHGEALHGHDREVRDAAHDAGMLTVLSGWGGDEGVSYNGDGFFAGQLLRGRLWWVLRWCHRFGGGTLLQTARIFYGKVICQQLGSLAPTPGSQTRRRPVVRELLRSLPIETQRVLLERSVNHRRLRKAASARENQRRLLNNSHIGGRIDLDAEWSIPAGFAFRYPLLDPELLGLVLAAPERLCTVGGRTRTLLRHSLMGIYPELIQRRHGKFISHPQRPAFVSLA